MSAVGTCSDADVGDLDVPGVEAAGRDRQPHLAAVERHRRSRLDRRPVHLPVDASTPEGTSTETTGSPAALIASITAAASRRGDPEKPVPNRASTRRRCRSARPLTEGRLTCPAEVSAASPANRPAVAEQRELDMPAGLVQQPADDEPVAAVRARSAPDGEPPRVGEATADRVGDSRARPLHQLERRAGDTSLPPPASPPPCRAARSASRLLRRVEDGADRRGQAPSSASSRGRSRRHRARSAYAFVAPERRTSRLRPARDLDLAPGEVHAAAERLADRLLPGEPSRVVLGRVGTRVAVVALGLGEDSAPGSRVASSACCDAGDLDQVDADPHRLQRSSRSASTRRVGTAATTRP